MDATQKSLLDESIEAYIAAIELELEQFRPAAAANDASRHPRRAPLPVHLPRTEHRHEPASTTCACGCAVKRMGKDLSETLDYRPGVIMVERHIRGK